MNSPNPKLTRTILYAVLIGGSFYSGTLIYPSYLESTNNQKDMNIVSVKEFRPILQKIVKDDFYLTTDNEEIIVKQDEQNNWIEEYTRVYSGKKDLRINQSAISEYLESLAPLFAIEPINANLKYSGDKAEIFKPAETGQRLDISKTVSAISTSLMAGEKHSNLVVEMVEPEITLEKINNLGINTLIGKGESDYGKSPASRIHNIKVGMARFNGTIIKPGEEFSFNKILGDVDEATGYQAELVIKSGKLIKEFGGGLCQVSTTVFRAAINTGLPITERKPHSFSVAYYNPQGFDSTIYPGVVDLKFINDTPNHILIQTKVIGSKLSVEIYGSNDGRIVEVERPIQYDIKPSGAMKAYFTRKITLKDGTVKEEKFNSSYKAHPPSPLEKNPLE